MKSLLTIGMFAVFSSLFFGCEKIDNAVDCTGICTRYKDCFDDSYDVPECVDRCNGDADKDDNYADKVDACDSCIDDESCTAATFKCATQCIDIVP